MHTRQRHSEIVSRIAHIDNNNHAAANEFRHQQSSKQGLSHEKLLQRQVLRTNNEKKAAVAANAADAVRCLQVSR